MEEHSHHRRDDPEYLEDHFVRVNYCEGRHADMERRIESIENSVTSLREGFQKLAIQLGAILGAITFLGVIANLVLNYLSVHAATGAHP